MKPTSWLEARRGEIEAALTGVIGGLSGPQRLLDAMAYSLLGGGKRLRGALVLASHALFPGSPADPMPAACALEMIHAYSLIHDDLPAMDDDDLRRGKPSCHRRFDEATAILAGDALLTEAFALLAVRYAPMPEIGMPLIADIAAAAGAAGMAGGQVLDTLGTGSLFSRPDIERLHAMKTGALIRASVRAGARLGSASVEEGAALSRFGDRIGLAFQITDDVLDAVGSPEALGKSPGKDRRQGKTTFVTLLGVGESRAEAWRLVDRAVEELERFGRAADPLRELARLFIERAG